MLVGLLFGLLEREGQTLEDRMVTAIKVAKGWSGIESCSAVVCWKEGYRWGVDGRYERSNGSVGGETYSWRQRGLKLTRG